MLDILAYIIIGIFNGTLIVPIILIVVALFVGALAFESVKEAVDRKRHPEKYEWEHETCSNCVWYDYENSKCKIGTGCPAAEFTHSGYIDSNTRACSEWHPWSF